MTTPTLAAATAVAAEHYAQRRSLVVTAVEAIAQWWSYLSRRDITGSWDDTVGPGLLAVVSEAQRRAVDTSGDYVQTLADVYGTREDPLASLLPEAWVGSTADRRPMATLLDQGRQATLRLVGEGLPPGEALDAGLVVTQRAAVTETQDAGRTADHVGMLVQPSLMGYTRFLNLPSCDRCVILAGASYRWSTGFQRHPQCDCIMLPTAVADPEPYLADPARAYATGQVTGLSRADRERIDAGEDMASIVNAKRRPKRYGLGVAGGGKRDTVEAILEATRHRDAALEQLRALGFVG